MLILALGYNSFNKFMIINSKKVLMRFLLFSFLIISISLKAQTNNTNSCKCCNEINTAFDFWAGNWQVVDASGKVLGTNFIDKIQDECILRENWESAQTNYTGTSYSFYNSNTEQWEQIWVDNQGGSLHLKGVKNGNQMILKTEKAKDKSGMPYYHRVTWTANEDGTVRQLWETITDETNVSVAFDGIYKKVKE